MYKKPFNINAYHTYFYLLQIAGSFRKKIRVTLFLQTS